MVNIWRALVTTFKKKHRGKNKHKENKPLSCKRRLFCCNHFARKLLKRWNCLRRQLRDWGICCFGSRRHLN